MKRRYAVLPGDGIGVDVTREAVKVMEQAAASAAIELELEHFDYGADRYLRTGETLPDAALEQLKTFPFGRSRLPSIRGRSAS